MRLPTASRPLMFVAAAVLATVIAACVADAPASACGTSAVEVELVLASDSLRPNNPRVCRGQRVTLLVDAEADGVIHIHGYDDAVPATSVNAGEETRLEFEAVRAGQFPIEFHAADDPQGVELGIFTVDEP